MRLFSALAATVFLLTAAPALAQDVPASPAVAAAAADLEAAGEAIEPVLTAMSERAAAIRADAALSDAEKQAGIEALIAENQSALDAFVSALSRFVAAEAMSEGASAEEADAAAAMLAGMVGPQLTRALLTGEDAD